MDSDEEFGSCLQANHNNVIHFFILIRSQSKNSGFFVLNGRFKSEIINLYYEFRDFR